ncbi:MAG: NYN domain-containing protein [Rhizomicrobium sp.]
MAFVDGQNLFQHAKAAFGHFHPNYDLVKLHAAVCAANGWSPNLIRFYTGVPNAAESQMWASYWSNRILAMKRAGIVTTTRPLRYRKDIVEIGGVQTVHTTPQEKGIDVRLALDVVSYARKGNFNVAVIYSQDQDLCEVVEFVRGGRRSQANLDRNEAMD